MGAQFSKKRDVTDETAQSPSQINLNPQITPDLSSYEAACRVDPDLQSFDSTLQERTSRVINTLAAGVEVRSLSLDSLRELTECLADTNQEVVKAILECKQDIWNNKDLFDLVQDYYNSSLGTLDFCTALKKCLNRTRDTQLIIQVALQQFDEEQKNGDYSRTLQELKNFKSIGNPFTEEFFTLFESVYNQQVLMLQKLQINKFKLDKKLKSLKSWRRVSNIVFAATFVLVLICTVVAAAVAAPPVVTALAAAAAVPLGSMGKWFDSLWNKYENEVKGQRDLIISIHVGTYIAIKDMDSIRVVVERLEIQIEALLQDSDFALTEEDSVILAVDDIKKKLSGFMKTIEDLGENADKFSHDITRARTVISHRIINHPSD